MVNLPIVVAAAPYATSPAKLGNVVDGGPSSGLGVGDDSGGDVAGSPEPESAHGGYRQANHHRLAGRCVPGAGPPAQNVLPAKGRLRFFRFRL
jgi:hypothetical protein